MSEQFKHIFTPIKIGNITLPNRIYLAAAGSPALSPFFGVPSEELINYFVERAKGGVGLIFDSFHYVGPITTESPYYSATEDSKRVPEFKKLTGAVHEQGAKIVAQLCNCGRRMSMRGAGGAAMGPSPIPFKGMLPGPYDIPHEMDIEQIKLMIGAYAKGAQVMREAGYDGVEIRCVTSFFPADFLSPDANHRTDEYGGSLDNRLRIQLEIIDAIREAAGRDFFLSVKYDADEFIPGGLTLDDAKAIARKLESTGKLDLLSIGGGQRFSIHIPSMYFPLGCMVHLAAGIKEVVSLPVSVQGRINDPTLAEQVLRDKQADMIGMARALICDPEFVNKAREERLDEIRRCIACNEACTLRYFDALPLRCTLNAAAGREKEYAISAAATRKRVMIIGGGAAGLEAARVAALRGHQVSLYEKDNELGGQLNIAAKAPGRADFAEAVRYFTYQMKLLGVDVHLGTTVTPEMVKENRPDAVVVATGSTAGRLLVPGGDGANVISERDVLQEKTPVGQNVLIVAEEHHNRALSTADFLVDRGKRVEVLTRAVYAGTQLDGGTLEIIYTRLLEKGVVITTLTGVKEIQGNAVIVYNDLTGKERRIEGIDTVVVASEGEADDALYRSLKGQAQELYLIGHALSPRRTCDSVWDGARAGRKI